MGTIDTIREFNNLIGGPKDLEYMLRNISTGLAAILFLVNTLQCFFGYKLTKLWISISGFFIFGMIGFLFSMGMKSGDGAVIVVLVFAVIGAFIAFLLYKIGVFLLGFFGGFIIGLLIANSIAAGILIGTIIGVLAVLFMKPVIILSTAIPAGIMAGSNLLAIFDCRNDELGILLGIIYALCGIAVQFITNSKNNNKKEVSNIDKDYDSIEKDDGVKSQIQQNNQKLQENAEKLVSAVNVEVNNKIYQTKEKVSEECRKAQDLSKNLSIFEVLCELKAIFYNNKYTKYIIAFCEYIFYALAVIQLIGLFIGDKSITSYKMSIFFEEISLIGLILSGILSIFVIAKNKYTPMIVYYSICSLTYLIKLFSKGNLIILHLSIIVIASILNILAIKFFLKSDEGKDFDKKIKNILNNSKRNQQLNTIIMIRCQKCGTVCSDNSKFCSTCGEQLKPDMVSNEIDIKE